MANFLETQLPNYAPYEKQLPTEEMVQVGMYKQQKYDEGLQKIQGNIDNIAGLDVYRDVDKAYLQSKLNQLGNNLSTVAAGDFSNFQLVNSVNGMTNQISKDPNVMNAVSSTATIRKGMSDMNEAKKAGKSSPSNEWMFNSQVNNYTNDQNLKSGFNGKYEQAIDTEKPLVEALKAAHADKFEGDENVYNGDGTINHDLLNHKLTEGLSTSKVAGIARSVYSDPSIARQLQIDGLYNYRNYNSDDLIKDKASILDSQKQKINDQTTSLKVYATLAKGDKKIQANKNLQSNQVTLDTLDSQFEKYKLFAIQNPDAAKTSMYLDNKIQQAINDFSWTTESSKKEVDPTFTINMEKSKFGLSQQEFTEKKLMDIWSIKNTKSEIDKRTMDAEIALNKLNGKLNGDGTPIWQANTPGIDSEINKTIGSSSLYADTKDKENRKNQLFADITHGIGGIRYNGQTYTDLYTKNSDTGVWGFNPKYLNKDPNSHSLLNDLGSRLYDIAKNNMKSKIDSVGNLHLSVDGPDKLYANDIKDWWDQVTVIQAQKQAAKDIESKYNPVMNQIAKNIGLKDNYTFTDVTGKPYNLTKNQLIDLSLYLNGRKQIGEDTDLSKQAYARISNSLGSDADNIISQITLNKSHNPAGENYGVRQALIRLTSELNKGNTKDQLSKREEDFKKLQRQSVGQELTYLPQDEKVNAQLRTGLRSELQRLNQDSTSGPYSDAITMLDKIKGSEQLVNDSYKFRHDDKTDKWFVRIQPPTGPSSVEIPIENSLVNNLQLNKQLNPKEQYFNRSTIGQLLNLNDGEATSNNMYSTKAYSTALERGSIGSYSVGFHIAAKGEDKQSYIPYMYIKDKEGNIYPHITMDYSKLATLPRLSKTEKQALLNQTPLYSKTEVVPAIEQFKSILQDPKYSDAAIKLLIGNYQKQ